MKPRLRAESVVLREELCILASCENEKKSVLKELRVGRLAVIYYYCHCGAALSTVLFNCVVSYSL